MSGGNWGFEFVDHIRSRRSWRTRIVLTVVSILAGAVLVALAAQFWGGRAGELPGQLILIVILLGLGIVFGLRPWARK
jgi:hypothetical protein